MKVDVGARDFAADLTCEAVTNATMLFLYHSCVGFISKLWWPLLEATSADLEKSNASVMNAAFSVK